MLINAAYWLSKVLRGAAGEPLLEYVNIKEGYRLLRPASWEQTSKAGTASPLPCMDGPGEPKLQSCEPCVLCRRRRALFGRRDRDWYHCQPHQNKEPRAVWHAPVCRGQAAWRGAQQGAPGCLPGAVCLSLSNFCLKLHSWGTAVAGEHKVSGAARHKRAARSAPGADIRPRLRGFHHPRGQEGPVDGRSRQEPALHHER